MIIRTDTRYDSHLTIPLASGLLTKLFPAKKLILAPFQKNPTWRHVFQNQIRPATTPTPEHGDLLRQIPDNSNLVQNSSEVGT